MSRYPTPTIFGQYSPYEISMHFFFTDFQCLQDNTAAWKPRFYVMLLK